MSNNEYGDGGINWCDIPFPDARSIANQSPEIIDNAVRRDATVMATRSHTSHMENELRAEIERLNALILQKDDYLFSLESSLATVEVEAKYAISLAESNASVKVRQLEEDIRRVTKEADIARFDVIRTKQVHQQQMMNMQQQKQQQQAKIQQPSAPLQHERMNSTQIKDDSSRIDGESLGGISNDETENDRQTADHDRKKHINYKLKESVCEITENTSQPLRQSGHLSSRKDVFIHRSSHITHVLLKQSLTKYKNKNYGDALNNRVELIISMITDMATIQPSHDHRAGSSMTMGNLVKEMIRALVIEFKIYSERIAQGENAKDFLENQSKHSSDFLENQSKHSSVNEKKRLREDRNPFQGYYYSEPLSQDANESLKVLQSILEIFNDLLSLSAEARKELRACISSSSRDKRNSYSSSIRDPARVMSRIRGIETSKDIISSIILGFNEGSYDGDFSCHSPCSFNEEYPSLYAQFMVFISDVIVGTLPSSILSRVEAISFIRSCVVDVCSEISKSSFSDEMLCWRVILDACFPYTRQTIVHGCKDIINILESDLDVMLDLGRRYYLLSENMRPVSRDCAPRNPLSFDSFKDATTGKKVRVILLKTASMHLISNMIQFSRTARDTIIHNTIQCEPETYATYRPHVTHAKRIMAAILDELQGSALPLLKSLTSKSPDDSLQPFLIPMLTYCKQSMYLIRVLCEFDVGFELVRTRMKSLNISDGSVKDTLPAISIIADCFIISGRVLIRYYDESFPTLVRLPIEWSILLGEVLLFFKLCLSRVQRLHKLIDDGLNHKRELISFLSILCEADRKESFCSVCQTLLLAKSNLSRGVMIEEDSYQIISSLLNEIAFDEEDAL